MNPPFARNVRGDMLETCSCAPLTGFFRTGDCFTSDDDIGLHVVCVEMTEEFLRFSKAAGNDLSTPRPDLNFPGLKPGDHWCLCAARWLEAYHAGAAPRVSLAASHERTLEIVPLKLLQQYALD